MTDIPAKGITPAGISISAWYIDDASFGPSYRGPKVRRHLDIGNGLIVMRIRL